MAVHRCAGNVDCIRSTRETRFFFTRAMRRNSKCVTRLFQWTTLLSEMYMRKTVKVGNIVQCYTCYDIYAPIIMILFADVKFTHLVTSVRFALSYTEKN